MVLEANEDTGAGILEVLSAVEAVGAGIVEVLSAVEVVGAGVGKVGVPVAVSIVDSAVVPDGLAIVGGNVLDVTGTTALDPSVDIPATVAVIVEMVSGTEFMMPAHIL